MAKYCGEGFGEGRIPRGARAYGGAGLAPAGRKEIRYWRAPTYVREVLGREADIKKAPGGFTDASTGEVVESQWLFVRMWQGKAVLVRRSMPHLVTFDFRVRAS